jgi:UDP-glucuronate 4-epimerase
MQTVLITGGAGFIGSNVIPKLIDKGYRVVCVDNFDDLYDPKLKEENIAPFLTNPNFVLERVDVRDLEGLKNIFEREKPAYIVHLAARPDTRDAVNDPRLYLSINVDGTLNVLELAKDYKVKNVALASSSSVYGNDPDVPWKETASADRPISPYGATKRTTEHLAHTYHHNFGLNVNCLRYFNAYGENNRPTMVPYLWGMAILKDEEIEISGDGSRQRDYTYVGDIAEGTIMAMEKPLGFEVFNLGNHEPVSLKDLLQVFEKVVGKRAKVKSRPSNKASVEVTYADISKAKKMLNWQPTTSIEDGVTKLVDWLRDHRLKETV